MKKSLDLLAALYEGKILYKVHHNDYGCVEFLIFEKFDEIYLPQKKGWGSKIGASTERVMEIITNPTGWNIFKAFDLYAPDIVYPWSSATKHSFSVGDKISIEGKIIDDSLKFIPYLTIQEINGNVVWFKEIEQNSWVFDCEKYKEGTFFNLDLIQVKNTGSLLKVGNKLVSNRNEFNEDVFSESYIQLHKYVPFQLVVISNDEIQSGDIVLLPNKTIHKMTDNDMVSYLDSMSKATKKIIASSDKKLTPNAWLPKTFVTRFLTSCEQNIPIINVTLAVNECKQPDSCGSSLSGKCICPKGLKTTLDGSVNVL